MLRTLVINSNQIVLSFGVLITFLSPKQSEIEESSLESISKSRIQGVWDPALYTRLCHFTPGRRYSTQMTSGIMLCRHFPSGCITSGIQEPDGSGGRFNFFGYTYPDPMIALTRRVYSHLAQCHGFLLKLPDSCDRYCEIFCFRYLMSKSPNSPCNPPIIGFLSL